jgi:cellulose synthase/poly-beta-1,6-N-acetylglucosamine synthase-like glycosyltransferase
MIGVLRATLWLSIGSIVYTYLGYPLALTLLVKIRGKHTPPTDASAPDVPPTVTLLIAAYNEQEVMEAKLSDSLELDYPADRLHILVAADGSDDRTAEIVRSFHDRGVALVYSPERRGKVAAINHAMAAIATDIVVFSDANNVYDRTALRRLVTPFRDPAVGGVVGAKRVARGDGALGDSEGLYWKYEAYILRLESELGSCTGAVGEIFAIRRDLFEPPPEGIINDDFYLAARLLKRGHRVAYQPDARSTDRVSLSAEDEMKRRQRIVAGRYQAIARAPELLPLGSPLIAWQMLSHKFLRPIVPFAMASAFLSNLALARVSLPRYRLLLAAQLAFYGLAALGRRTTAGSAAGRLLYLPTFLVQSNLAAVAGLYDFLVKSRTMHLWDRVPRRL